jgi:hypothetical protein
VGAGAPRGPRKATIAKIEAANIREQIKAAELAADKMGAARKRLAKDELEELLPIIKETARRFQRAAIREDATGLPGGANFDVAPWTRFKEWIEFYASVCYRLADFQSPRFKAIAVMAPQPEPQGRKPDVIPRNDPVAGARVYQRLITAVRG